MQPNFFEPWPLFSCKAMQQRKRDFPIAPGQCNASRNKNAKAKDKGQGDAGNHIAEDKVMQATVLPQARPSQENHCARTTQHLKQSWCNSSLSGLHGSSLSCPAGLYSTKHCKRRVRSQWHSHHSRQALTCLSCESVMQSLANMNTGRRRMQDSQQTWGQWCVLLRQMQTWEASWPDVLVVGFLDIQQDAEQGELVLVTIGASIQKMFFVNIHSSQPKNAPNSRLMKNALFLSSNKTKNVLAFNLHRHLWDSNPRREEPRHSYLKFSSLAFSSVVLICTPCAKRANCFRRLFCAWHPPLSIGPARIWTAIARFRAWSAGRYTTGTSALFVALRWLQTCFSCQEPLEATAVGFEPTRFARVLESTPLDHCACFCNACSSETLHILRVSDLGSTNVFISVSGTKASPHPPLFPCHRGLLFGYLYLVWGPPDASWSSWDDLTRSALWVSYLNWRKKSLYIYTSQCTRTMKPKEKHAEYEEDWTWHAEAEWQDHTWETKEYEASKTKKSKRKKSESKGNRKRRALRDPLLADLLNPRIPDQTDNGIACPTHDKGNTNVHSCICWLHTVAKHPWPSKCKDATLTSMHVRTWRSREVFFSNHHPANQRKARPQI